MAGQSAAKYAGWLLVELIGLGCMAAYLLKLYENEFDMGKWENWARVSPYFITGFAMINVFLTASCWSRQNCDSRQWCIFLYFLNMGLVGFNLCVSTTTTSYNACVGMDYLCLEYDSCSGSVDDSWKAVLYNLGLTIMLTGHSLALNVLFRYLEPDSISEISETARVHGDKDNYTNSPGLEDKRIQDQTINEKTDVSLPPQNRSNRTLVQPLSEENLAKFESQQSRNYDDDLFHARNANEDTDVQGSRQEQDAPSHAYNNPTRVERDQSRRITIEPEQPRQIRRDREYPHVPVPSGNIRQNVRHQSVVPSGTINDATVRKAY